MTRRVSARFPRIRFEAQIAQHTLTNAKWMRVNVTGYGNAGGRIEGKSGSVFLPLERRALEVFEESDDEVYQARHPRMKNSVERDGAVSCHDFDRTWLLSEGRSDRLRENSFGRSNDRFGFSLHDDVGREVLDEENWETASMARDLTLDSAAFMVGSDIPPHTSDSV